MPFPPVTSHDEVRDAVRALYHPTDRPYVTADEVAERLNVNVRTARRYLARLTAQGRLRRKVAYRSSRGYGFRPVA